MFPVMKESHKFNGYLFVVVLLVMLIYSAPKLFSYAKQDMDTVTLYFDGQLARNFEDGYDSEFFLREASVESWANLQYLLFSEGLDGVVIGKDDWLFTKEELMFSNDLDLKISSGVEDILSIQELLAAKGKQLVVVPVPLKADIYSEYVPYQLGDQPAKTYTSFVDQLNQFNILNSPVRDLYFKSKDESRLFLKKDTHWTPEGAEIAAKALAENFPRLIGETKYRTYTNSSEPFKGDLLNFIKASDWVAGTLLEPELLPHLETLKVTEEGDFESDLFGDQSISVALVGTSYTAIDEWNFHGFLREYLKQDLISVALKEKGPFAAMDKFINSDEINDPSINFVIWEFPVRTLLTKNVQ